MPIGMQNISSTNITIGNITKMINITEPMEFFINVNDQIYGGVYFFIMLFVFWAILFMAAQGKENKPLKNALYSGAIVSLVSFFYRAIFIVRDGVVLGLLTDFQMWVFPLITIFIAITLYATRE